MILEQFKLSKEYEKANKEALIEKGYSFINIPSKLEGLSSDLIAQYIENVINSGFPKKSNSTELIMIGRNILDCIEVANSNGFKIGFNSHIVDELLETYKESRPNAYNDLKEKSKKFDYGRFARENIVNVLSNPINFVSLFRLYLHKYYQDENSPKVLGLNYSLSLREIEKISDEYEKELKLIHKKILARTLS